MEIGSIFNATNAATHIQTLVIFLTSLSVYIIYKLKKDNEMKFSAQIMCLEIRNIDQQILTMQSRGDAATADFSETTWNIHKHILIKKLNQSDLTLMEHYFNQWNLIQDLLSKQHTYNSDAFYTRAMRTQQSLVEVAEKLSFTSQESQYKEIKDKFLALVHEESYWYIPSYITPILKQQISTFNPLIGTTTYEKLKNLAKLK